MTEKKTPPVEAVYRCRACDTPWHVWRPNPPDRVECRFCGAPEGRRIK